MVIALKDLKGRQMDYGRFRFSWTISENEENAYFVWIYKENVSIPVMISYSQCINHCMESLFSRIIWIWKVSTVHVFLYL